MLDVYDLTTPFKGGGKFLSSKKFNEHKVG